MGSEDIAMISMFSHVMQSLNQYAGCTTEAAKDLASLQTSVVAMGLVLCNVNQQMKVTVEQAL